MNLRIQYLECQIQKQLNSRHTQTRTGPFHETDFALKECAIRLAHSKSTGSNEFLHVWITVRLSECEPSAWTKLFLPRWYVWHCCRELWGPCMARLTKTSNTWWHLESNLHLLIWNNLNLEKFGIEEWEPISKNWLQALFRVPAFTAVLNDTPEFAQIKRRCPHMNPNSLKIWLSCAMLSSEF